VSKITVDKSVQEEDSFSIGTSYVSAAAAPYLVEVLAPFARVAEC
jgi:hypothetical protein